MYKVSEFNRKGLYDCEMVENVNTIERKKKIETAISKCKELAKEFKQQNETIKLLDYERTYKSEKLVYGVYCIDILLQRVIKEYRVYET